MIGFKAMPEHPHPPRHAGPSAQPPSPSVDVSPVKMTGACPETYDGTCLRPLGLCELGGCCDVCWYRPSHPRFRRGNT
jgi:hypothetical protein